MAVRSIANFIFIDVHMYECSIHVHVHVRIFYSDTCDDNIIYTTTH